ncbi:MAG: ABC transporter permease [Anaerolineae bacterium]|nr:ABC transporter permease [Anaerolineae bacterium]
MIYDLELAWRNLRNRPVEALIPILVVGLAIALSVSVIVLADGAETGVVQASDPFGVLVIGAAGSGQQLVLSSILLQGNPIGNIPFHVYEELENDPRVQLAVPLALGDNVGGARIIGTNHHFFELRADQSAPPAFQLAEGRLFEEVEHNPEEAEDHDDHEEFPLEAVLGSKAAELTGLHVGDQFAGTHGVSSGIAENVHEEHVYTVVGILQASGTAYDTAVYTQVESVWHVHEHHEEGVVEEAEAAGAAETEQVTSVLILPTGFIEQNQLAQEFYVDPILQAAFPGQELGDLLNLLNQGQEILNTVGYLVLGIAGLTVFLSMYTAVIAHKQSIAIMRGLGSRRLTVFRMVVFETLIVLVAGAIVGRLLGYGIAAVIAMIFSQQSAIPVSVRFMPEIEVLLWSVSLGVGFLAAVIPAMLAYRVEVVENLFPS